MSTAHRIPSNESESHVPAPLRHLAETLLHVVPAAQTVELATDDVHSVHVRLPMEFKVEYGEVLVTVEGDLEDHVLGAGETFRTDRRGHHVVEALRPSRVHVAARPH